MQSATRTRRACQYCRGVRFEQRLRDGIHSGAIVLAFRRWRRSQVVPGRRYRTGIDMVEVESVDVVEPLSVDAAQAGEAGYASVGELLADLRGDPALPVYRIRLRRIDGPDPRDELACAARLSEADVAAITARLARMDRSSSRGPWTGAVLALIADRPGIVSMSWSRSSTGTATGTAPGAAPMTRGPCAAAGAGRRTGCWILMSGPFSTPF